MIPPATHSDDAELNDAANTLRGRTTKHRLVVLGADEPEVVRTAGGLIYDWSSAGGDVTVQLGISHDDRPLRILGVKTSSPIRRDSLRGDPLWPDAIITSQLLFRENLSVRAYFAEAAARGYAATAMSGNDWPSGLDQSVGHIRHRLSPAARAFKLQAMLAAGVVPEQLGSTELFRTDAALWRNKYFVAVDDLTFSLPPDRRRSSER